MDARSQVTGTDGHKTIKVNTSKTRTLDEAAKEYAEELYRQHRECLPTLHFIAQGGHKEQLKLDEAKTEALRRQRQLEKDASTLASGGQAGARVWCGKKWKPSTVQDHVLLQGVRHGCLITCVRALSATAASRAGAARACTARSAVAWTVASR